MKIAFVYDRVNKFGGAERVLLALHTLWPDAPLYTSVYDFEKAPWARSLRIIPSVLQKMPLPKHRHERYPYLMPLAFESFSFEEYDIVLSITSAEAKSIITKPQTLHLCYQLTPTRYLWNDHYEYQQSAKTAVGSLMSAFVFPLQSVMRIWDAVVCSRPDSYIAISQTVSNRLKKYYHVSSKVIYPPVDVEFFQPITDKRGTFFLAVGRLVPTKRFDIIIHAFNRLGWPLKIIGQGIQESELRKMAGSNIEFLGGNLTDWELLSYYQGCHALLVAGEEDFGLVGLEAMACGKPIIAYGGGGLSEIIQQNKTGILFYPQTSLALYNVLLGFTNQVFSPEVCRRRAMQFSQKLFKERFRKLVSQLFADHCQKISQL